MARNACAQWLVLPDESLLMPIYFAKAPNVPASVTVLHYAFDGRKLTCLKHGDELSLNVVRGLCEPSIIAFRDRFYLTIVAKGQASPRGANGSVFAARVLWSKPNELAPRQAR